MILRLVSVGPVRALPRRRRLPTCPPVREPAGCAGVARVPCSAAICKQLRGMFYTPFTVPNNRSKFNVALGVESQGFCLLPPR